MKKYFLILIIMFVLFAINGNEVWAEVSCYDNQKVCGKVCIALSAVCYTCGTDCHAYYTGEGDNKTLNITGTGKMYNYETGQNSDGEYYSKDTPWKDDTFKNVVIDNGITSIGKAAFTGFGITSATIADTVTIINNSAFLNNKLSSVNIPDTVTSIGQSAFLSNELTSIVLPDSLTTVNNFAFFSNPLI